MSTAAQMLSTPGRASRVTARFYDTQLALERAALGVALELVAPRAHEYVLDIAAGTGALLDRLARYPAPPSQVLGIDASGAMISRAPALPSGWRLIKADARRVPLADASVDVVTCTYLLHLLDEPDRRLVLNEIVRVLRPGGRVVIVTLLEPCGLLGRALLAPAQWSLCRVLGPSSGWCAADPSDELASAGLRLRNRRLSTRGYASLCLLADRRPSEQRRSG